MRLNKYKSINTRRDIWQFVRHGWYRWVHENIISNNE